MLRYGSTVLFVEEVPKVLAFYEAAFGFQTAFYDEAYEFGELEAGGLRLGVGSHRTGERMMPGAYRRPTSGHPEGVEIAFFTEEVAGAYARAVEAGAVPVAEPREMEWGQTVAYVRAPEGTVIGLCSPLEAA